jgi:hypothetical protein
MSCPAATHPLVRGCASSLLETPLNRKLLTMHESSSFSLDRSDCHPRLRSCDGLLPMARNPNPAAGTVHPVAFDPYCRCPRSHNPTAGHPNISCPRPSPIPRSPDISRSRRDCYGLDPNRRRRLSDKHFASSWCGGSYFPRHGRCCRERWLFSAADQCQR